MTDNESAAVQPGGEVDVSKLRIKTQVFSRIVGYLTPVDSWNIAKQHEFGVRHKFDDKPDFSMEPDEQL